jgi:hypothetical protein
LAPLIWHDISGFAELARALLNRTYHPVHSIPMDKIQLRAAARAVMRSSPVTLPPLDRALPRTTRESRPPPLDKARARQACAPMGTLHSIVVTINPRKRRRTWYVIDPDLALSAQYAAAGFDLIPGCKVLVDAEAMRPVALLDFDPAVSAQDSSPMLPQGFNPYFDLPAG